MHVKRSLIVVLLTTVAVGFSHAENPQADEFQDLNALYEQIDDAILHSEQYIAERERQITACQNRLMREGSTEERIKIIEELFFLYQPYKNDSALYYAQLCISLANTIHRPDISGRFRSLLAYQCSNCNMYSESIDQLSKIDKSALDQAGLVEYYNAWMHVYGELGSLTQIKDMRNYYFDLQDLYRDSVMMVAKEGSENWLHLKMDILSARQSFQEALSISNLWLKNVSPDTHESAFAAFYRSMVYDRLGNHNQKCYWLGKSALADIRCAVMSQASLLFLAEQLANDDDITRARRYMEFTRECNMVFCPRVRIYQIDPYISILEKSCQATQKQVDWILWISISMIVLLLVVLIYVLSHSRRKQGHK